MNALMRFERLLKLAQKNEQNYAIQLGKARDLSLKQLQKLEQLTEYQTEYRKNLFQQASTSISGNTLREYERFLHQLKMIIQQQEQIYENSLYEVKIKCKEWESAYQSRLKLTKLIENCQKNEQRIKEKNDQKMLDELVSHRQFEKR